MPKPIRPVSLVNGVASVTLTKGYFATVDVEHSAMAGLSNWQALVSKWGVYAVRSQRDGDGINRFVYLHREIVGANKAQYVDHINRDTLDNRRENLRLVTNSQNGMNQRRNSSNTSGVKGVSWNKRAQKWSVYIKMDQKRFFLGHYDLISDAAKAYADGSNKFHGEFGRVDEATRQPDLLIAPPQPQPVQEGMDI